MAMTTCSQRIVAAIRGAFIADAASMGTHWTYDPNEMVKTVTSTETPEFREPPAPKYYSADEFPGHYGPGMLSPYGEQMVFVTEHVASTADFGGAKMSQEMLTWATTFGGRPDHALTTFVENMKKDDASGKWPNCGADDDQAHFYMKVVPVTCRYAGSSELIDKVTQAIQVHQNNQKAIAFGIASARLLEAVLLGAPLDEALATVEKNLGDELQSQEFKDDVIQAFARGKQGGTSMIKDGLSFSDFLKEVSHEVQGEEKKGTPFYDLAARSCALPGSFIGPIALLYKYSHNKEAYSAALRDNIFGSGDTCSRSVFLGAMLAAAGDAIPSDWSDKMDAPTMKKINDAAKTIAAAQESK